MEKYKKVANSIAYAMKNMQLVTHVYSLSVTCSNERQQSKWFTVTIVYSNHSWQPDRFVSHSTHKMIHASGNFAQ